MIINFAKGHPDPAMLPHALMALGFERVAATLANATAQQTAASANAKPAPRASLAAPLRTLLDYCPSQGDPGFRTELASFITRQANDGCAARANALMTVRSGGRAPARSSTFI